jgi:hypothetical protein
LFDRVFEKKKEKTFFSDCIDPEDGFIMLFRSDGDCSPIDRASHHRTLESTDPKT